MDDLRVLLGHFLDDGGCVVGGMIIDNENIVLEICLLWKDGFDGFRYGLFPVTDGNDDGCFGFKFLLLERDGFEHGGKVGPDSLQVGGERLFHFNLYFPVTRVHVIKLFFTGTPGVVFFLRVQEFGDPENQSFPGKTQAQVVECGEMVLRVHFTDDFL